MNTDTRPAYPMYYLGRPRSQYEQRYTVTGLASAVAPVSDATC